MSKLTESPEELAKLIEIVGWPKRIDNWEFDLKLKPKEKDLVMTVRFNKGEWHQLGKFPNSAKAQRFVNALKDKSDADIKKLLKLDK